MNKKDIKHQFRERVKGLASPYLSYWRERVAQPMRVNMSSNPLDLRPAAYAITNRIKALKELYPERPLIVPIGEDHTHIPSQMVHQAVMQCCLNRGIVPAYAVEETHRMFEQMLSIIKIDISKDFADDLLASDPHNKMLRDLMMFGSEEQIDTQLWQFCDDHDLSISFNDCARVDDENGHSYLDYQDDETRNIARALGYPIHRKDIEQRDIDDLSDDDISLISKSGHYICSNTGFHVRNAMMLRKMMTHYKAQQPDAMILKTGSIHLYGLEHQQRALHVPYDQSMTALFNEVAEGAICVPIMPLYDRYPISSQAYAENAVFLEGVNDHQSTQSCEDEIRAVVTQSSGLLTYYPILSDRDHVDYFKRFKSQLRTHSVAYMRQTALQKRVAL